MKREIRGKEQFLCMGRNILNHQSVTRSEHRQHHGAQVSAMSPSQALRDEQLKGSPQASFQSVPGGRAGIVCPVLPSFLRGVAETS